MKRARSVLFASALPFLMLLSGCAGGPSGSVPPPAPPPNPNPAPAVASVSPSSVVVGSANTPVTVTGTGFISSSTVQWNGTALATTFAAATSLSATIPASDLASATVGQLTVVNPAPGGGMSSAVSFAVNNPAPVVTTVGPSAAPVGSTAVPVTVTGSGFVASSTVQWNGVGLATTFGSATSLSATIPASDLTGITVAQLTVVNPAPGGGTSSAVSFAVNNPAPVAASVSPSSVAVGSANTPVAVTGTGFVASSVVQWNGVALATTFGSATSLNAAIPASDLASATVGQLTVTNPAPGGGTSAAVSFSVTDPTPAVTSVTPNNVVAGASDTLVDVMGSGFVSGSVVAWNGTALATTFVSATELKATVPAADLTGSSASQISVENPAPGGGASGGTAFTVSSPTPAITGISPQYVPPGVAATITITGTGFESNSVALWNGSARPTAFVSATTLTVSLSAADLQNQGTGSLTVSNPAPGPATSGGSTLTVTSIPVPVIQSVTVATSSQTASNGCPELQATITGQNFDGGFQLLANGVTLLQIGGTISGNTSTINALFPAGFVSAPGALSFMVSNPGSAPVVSNPFPYPATSPAALNLCASPASATVYAPSSFSIVVQPSEVNVGGNVTLTLGALPTGISWANSSVPVPPGGTTIHLQAASTVVAGPYSIGLNGAAGGVSGQGSFSFTVSAGAPPGFGFTTPLHDEVGVPIGGSGSIQYSTAVSSNSVIDYDVVPSVSGLPPGTTVSFSPAEFSAGQNVTVTLTAASNAPVTQNAQVTLTGTPSAQVASAAATFFVDVTQPPGSLPGNRSDFVSTGGTPYAAVYDAVHNLIFSSNPSWNRVDVISNATHQIVKSLAVRSPRWIDITQDSSTVWVQTGGINVYAINTSSLQANQYTLPGGPVASAGIPVNINTQWDRLLALADGTLFVYFNDSEEGAAASAGIWKPQTNQMTVLVNGTNSGLGTPARSGDGTLVYASGGAAYLSTGMSVYTVSSKTFSTINSGTSYNPVMAVNQDGSRLALGFENNASLYDQHLNLLGPLPGTLQSSAALIEGGILFTVDGTRIYELVNDEIPGIVIVDASSLNVLGIAPGEMIEGSLTVPFAIDASGMILGRQNYGISFDDATFVQNYAVNQPSVAGGLPTNSVFDGPLSGGTVIGPYLFPDLIPDVWFGPTRGAASIAGGQLSVTSPAGTTPGPVNIKMIFPDGEQIFAPEFFTYSTFPEYAVLSGSSPNGGAAGQVLGYGLPVGPTGGALTVGGNQAAITPPATSSIPFSGEPFPSTILSYTFPQGTPGPADLTVTTPNGSGTLPKSIYYAKSVTDYSSTDSFSAVLFDSTRNQVYLSAGNHIDVFSTTANQFLAPFTPAAQGTSKQFAGLALTPDGSELLAADLADGSLAVINPDSGSSTVIPVIAASQSNGCTSGPLYVSATSSGLAFVGTGSLPTTSCAPAGSAYIVNLQTQAVSVPPCSGGVGVDASNDGNFVVVGSSPCIYSVQSASYAKADFPFQDDGYVSGISGDANVIVANEFLADVNANMLGAFAQPLALYGSSTQLNPPMILLHPRFNASGSLFYMAYPNYFEIVDVPQGLLRMRFSLTETVQYDGTPEPIAIDSGGRYVFLITNQGLTVVDLGAAPLSIGHLTPQSAAAGTAVTVRGSGFDTTVTATVGGIAAAVSFTDENTLTLTLPAAAASGPQDIVLTRADGEVYTLQNGVVIQ